MSLVDKFKSFMGVPDDEFYDDDDETMEEEEEISVPPIQEESVKTVNYDVSSNWQTTAAAPEYEKKDDKVVNINATTQLQVILVKPEKFDDASGIADHLNAKRTVVLNLESAGREISRRMLDFLSGVAYANSGQIKKVANATYIITPYNVGVIGDTLLDELENNGVYF